ncbi:MAG: hypothetical protein J6A59_07155 [Lachnospiraceae bacterium]|nr:hypothetical protein [Lachnospiraceae bacterium]
MINNKINYKKITIALAIVMLFPLSGCGKKQVDYSEATKGQTEVVEDGIPQHLEYTITGEATDVVVNADVVVPDAYRSCTVMELTKKTFQTSDIEYYVDYFFDEGTDFLYMPYNKEEMSEIKGNMEPLLKQATDPRTIDAFECAMEEPESYPETEEEMFEEYRFYNMITDERCQIFGAIDGEYYVLSFFKDGINCVMRLERFDNTSTNLSLQDVAEDDFYIKTSGNTCTYTKEEAEKLALDYVNELGYDNFSIIQTNNTKSEYWFKDNDKKVDVDGYSIYLGRTYDNYAYTYSSNYCFDYSTDEIFIFGKNGSSKIAVHEYIRICVDSKGIRHIYYFNPMEEVGALTEEVELLDFAKVQAVADERFKNMAKVEVYGYGTGVNISEIRLGYGYDINGENKVLIPMWYFFNKDDNEVFGCGKNDILRINALDGRMVLDTSSVVYIEN